MNLQEQIDIDFKEAFKAKEQVKLGTLKMLVAAIRNAEIAKKTKLAKEGKGDLEGKSKLNDEEVLEIINREAKKRKDAIEAYEKGGRTELAEQEKAELGILSAYLPEQLSEDEIRVLVKKAIEQTGASSQQDMGKVMGALMPQVKGKSDGAMVSKIVKESLVQS